MPRKINLLYVVHNLLVGGAQELVKFMSLNVDRKRFNPMVCSLVNYPGKGEVEPLTDDIRRGGVEVHTLFMERFEGDPERGRFMALLRDNQVDVVHSHLYHTDLWASVMAKEAGVRAVLFSKHDTYRDKNLWARIHDAWYFNRSADAAVATSETTLKHLLRYEFILPSKVRKLNNLVDTELFDPERTRGDLRLELGIPQGAPVVGNIARFVPRKGVDAFIRTCSRVSERIPGAWFLLVGYGEYEGEYRGLADRLGVKNLIFAGSRRDLPEALKTMDIFLFTPYYGEAFPMVMLEAMSMGKAIVASNVGSNRELIEDGASGLLPAPVSWCEAAGTLDERLLADAVVGLIERPDIARAYGDAARRLAVGRFGLRAVMAAYESLYEEILTKNA